MSGGETRGFAPKSLIEPVELTGENKRNIANKRVPFRKKVAEKGKFFKKKLAKSCLFG